MTLGYGGGHAKSHHESENYLLYVPFCAGYYEEHFVGMEVLGEGAFGVVFKAMCIEDNCAYAVKISKDARAHQDRQAEVEKLKLVPQGLAPRVSPRTLATTSKETLSDSIAEVLLNNPTTIDDILFSTDPDRPQSHRLSPALFTPVNERMETEETTSTSTTTTTATTGEKLISLRKEFKKVSASLEKTKAYLDFAGACQAERQTPKGLRINVRCSALMVNLTNAQTQFDRTTNRAQENYVGHLRANYEELAEQLGKKYRRGGGIRGI